MADIALYESDGPVGYVTLNRPDKLNAISDELRIRASEALERAALEKVGEDEQALVNYERAVELATAQEHQLLDLFVRNRDRLRQQP